MSFTLLEVIMRPKNIARNNGSEHAPVLLIVGMILYVDETLGMTVAKVRGMGWTIVHLEL